jgi:cell volume regulation protein A
MGLENAEAYTQIIFFIILSSVIITTIGLGKSKNIPPPESVEGGFVKKSDNSQDGIVDDSSIESVTDSVDGGFVKKSE